MDFMKKRFKYLNRQVELLQSERERLMNELENIDYRLGKLEPQVWETLELIVDERYNKCTEKDGRIVD